MGKVITITREFGSMGRNIAKLVAEKMKYNYYDRDIIELATKELRGNIDQLSAFEGKKVTVFGKMMYPLGLGTAAMQEKLYEMEKSIIIELATTENCVIVGRCSDYILHECGIDKMLNVFIYAPYSKRIELCQSELNLTPSQAEKYIEDVDKARQNFYKYHTGVGFHSTKYRQLMIDSSTLPFDDCADIICGMANHTFSDK